MADQQWDFILDLVRALKPLDILTKKLQTVQYTIGDLIRDIWVCEEDLEELGFGIASELLQAITIRKKMFMENPHFNAPLTSEAKAAAVKFLEATNERIKEVRRNYGLIRLQQSESECEIASSSSSGQSVDMESAAKKRRVSTWFATKKFAPKLFKPNDAGGQKNLERRLEKLADNPIPVADFDVLTHWKLMCGNDEEMADLATVVLAVPASQVSVERSLNRCLKF